jgi:hypothetical protein
MMTINNSRSAISAAFAGLVGLFGFGVATLPGTARAADDSAIASMRWMTGVWQTQPRPGGGQIEVIFEPARGGEIVSTFTSTANGRITRYEMRTIRVQDGKVIFTEAAFGPGMKPLPAPPDRALELADATHANFVGMESTRTGTDSMTTTLTSKRPDGSTRSSKTEFHRVMRFAQADGH